MLIQKEERVIYYPFTFSFFFGMTHLLALKLGYIEIFSTIKQNLEYFTRTNFYSSILFSFYFARNAIISIENLKIFHYFLHQKNQVSSTNKVQQYKNFL